MARRHDDVTQLSWSRVAATDTIKGSHRFLHAGARSRRWVVVLPFSSFLSMQNGSLLAAIDLGSNSFRLEIGQVDHGQIRRTDPPLDSPQMLR